MLVLLLSAFLTAPPVGGSAQAAPPVAAPKPAKPKKVCRTETSTGSILPKTVCRSQEQWDDIDFANHNAAQFRRDIVSTTASPHPE